MTKKMLENPAESQAKYAKEEKKSLAKNFALTEFLAQPLPCKIFEFGAVFALSAFF